MLPRLNNVQNFENHYAFSPLLYRTTDISFNRVMFEGSLAYKHVFIPEKSEMSVLASVSKSKGTGLRSIMKMSNLCRNPFRVAALSLQPCKPIICRRLAKEKWRRA